MPRPGADDQAQSLEKRDATYHGREPFWIIDAVSRYKTMGAPLVGTARGMGSHA